VLLPEAKVHSYGKAEGKRRKGNCPILAELGSRGKKKSRGYRLNIGKKKKEGQKKQNL